MLFFYIFCNIELGREYSLNSLNWSFFSRLIIFNMRFRKNILLKNYTTFKIGGRVKYFVVAKTKKDIVKAVLWAKKNHSPFFILGGGSNLLVADERYDGLVIKIQNSRFQILDSKVVTGAGLSLGKLVNTVASTGLKGMEWASGIPSATIGGAIRGNAGAFGSEMKDFIEKVEVFDSQSGKIKIFKNKDCKFKYRESIFKNNPNLIILSAQLKFKKGDKNKIKEKMQEYLSYRHRHPKFPSAGSIFKNPKNIKARELIEKCGLAGKTIGRAQIAKEHGNFIINLGGARAKDVLSLIALVKKRVKEKFGITLKEEIQYLN